ncbi:hypothetical protein Bca4012_103075 [Brassica carinata]
MHGHHAACGALPAAGPYLRLSRFQGGQADRLTHVQVPFTWNLSPLRPSKFSFEYLLLPPRSAPAAAPPGSRPRFCSDRRALLLIEAWLLPDGGYRSRASAPSISGLVDSAGNRRNQLLDGSISLSPLYPSQASDLRQYRCGPPPEFPLAARSGIVHHLSGPDRYAHTRTLLRRSRSVGSAPVRILPISFLTPYGFTHPLTRTHVRLLGPCFKAGRMGAHRPTP